MGKITHGATKTRLFGVWGSMLKRCYNPNCKSYKDYGGRGIGVCDEWRHDFSAFQEWSLSHGYDSEAKFMKCTIDRIDCDKGYSPDNCRWVDCSIQGFNRSQTKSNTGFRGVYLTKNGKYHAKIVKNYHNYFLGLFDDINDAIEARRKAEEKYYGMVVNK